MSSPFSSEELNRLSAEVDQQLQILESSSSERGLETKSFQDSPDQKLPQAQRNAIAQATGEEPEKILKKFVRVARKDLCEADGMLYQQWQKWGDLQNKETLDKLGAAGVALGLSGEILPVVAAAITVIIIHLGVRTICEEYASEPGSQSVEKNAWDVLEEAIGTIDAPADWSVEHDHYLYGTPKRSFSNQDD